MPPRKPSPACSANHQTTHTAGARCGQCSEPLQWEVTATLHPYGSTDYLLHRASEQIAMQAHLEAVTGRALTDDERNQLNHAVSGALRRNAQPAPKPRPTSKQRPNNGPSKPSGRSTARPKQGQKRTASRPSESDKEETSRVKAHDRIVNGKKIHVKGHTRKNDWSHSKATWIAAGTTGTTVAGLLVQAAFGAVGLILMLVIALVLALAAFASARAVKSKSKVGRNVRSLSTRPKRRTGTRTTGTRRTTKR